jgi:hypothetical protein
MGLPFEEPLQHLADAVAELFGQLLCQEIGRERRRVVNHRLGNGNLNSEVLGVGPT